MHVDSRNISKNAETTSAFAWAWVLPEMMEGRLHGLELRCGCGLGVFSP